MAETGERAWLESAALAAAGAATFAAGLWLVEDDSDARAVVQAIGAAAIVLSPLAPRLETFTLGLRGLEAKLAGRPGGRKLLDAALDATDEKLLAVLPLLDEQVGVEILGVPTTAAGLTLKDEPLRFIRRDHDVEIVAMKPPDARRWTAGGVVSRTAFPAGTELLALGLPGDLEAVKVKLALVRP